MMNHFDDGLRFVRFGNVSRSERARVAGRGGPCSAGGWAQGRHARCDEGTVHVSMDDKIENKTEELKGKAKEAAGEATDNEQWQAEGRAEQTKSKLSQAGQKLKDAAKDAFGSK